MRDNAQRIIELERMNLEFIQIFIKYQPPKSALRTFLDEWFAYNRGELFLSGRLGPHWYNKPDPVRHNAALRGMDFISEQAEEVLSGRQRHELMKDHSVPIAVVRSKLFELNDTSIESIRSLLMTWYKLGVITKDEDTRLNANGLRQKMPDDWDGADPFARYHAVGIKVFN